MTYPAELSGFVIWTAPGVRSIFGPIVESIAWYTCSEVPPAETLLPDINTPITIAFDNPPGTTDVGTEDQV